MKVTKEQIVGFVSSTIIYLIMTIVFSFVFLGTKVINSYKEVFIDCRTINNNSLNLKIKNVQINDKRLESRNSRWNQKNVLVNKNSKIVKNNNIIKQLSSYGKRKRIRKNLDKIKDFLVKRYKTTIGKEQIKSSIDFQISNAFKSKELSSTNKIVEKNEGSVDDQESSKIGNKICGDVSLYRRFLRFGELQLPSYYIVEDGCIVVEITVNSQGDVIMANVCLKGTNIANSYMRSSAVNAAKETKFNVIEENKNQTGVIIYRYTLK